MNNRLIHKMFYTTMIVQLCSMLIQVFAVFVDGAVIGGCLGASSLASYGFAIPVATVFSGIATVFSAGISVLCGRAIARGDKEEANRIFSQGVWAALIVSIPLLLFCFWGADWLAAILGAGSDLEKETAAYIRGYVLCAPALMMLLVLMPIMQIDSDKTRIIKAVCIMTGINVSLDLVAGLILHKGLFYIALCTTIAYYAGSLVLLMHFGKSSSMFRLPIARSIPKIQSVMELISCGLPDALQKISRSFLNICLNHILLITGGAFAVSAFSAVYSASLLCMILGSCIGDSIYVMNSLLAGEKDTESMKIMLRTALKTALLLNAALSVIVFATAPVFMRLFFNSDESAFQIAVTGFKIYSLSIVFYSLNVVWRTYYQSMHLLKIAHSYVVLNNFCFIALSAYVLSRFFGTSGVWYSFLAGQVLTLLFIMLLNLPRIRRAGALDGMMRLPADFASEIVSSYSWSAHTLNEIVQVSESVGRICKAERVPSRISFILSLMVEEIAVNIYTYGFAEKKTHSIDVKLQHLNDGWLIRIRDDCRLFDPTRYVALYDYSSPEEHIGIRMVKKLASRIEYTSALKLNNLLITLDI